MIPRILHIARREWLEQRRQPVMLGVIASLYGAVGAMVLVALGAMQFLTNDPERLNVFAVLVGAEADPAASVDTLVGSAVGMFSFLVFTQFLGIASVLAGSVWGDHCSPISDTTILSSMASGCDHIQHVRTQLPYALLVGAVSLGAGSLPVAFGMPWWLGLAIGAALLFIVLRLAGRTADSAEP